MNYFKSIQYDCGAVLHSALRAPATIDNEGLADVAAANPFRLPRNRVGAYLADRHGHGMLLAHVRHLCFVG
jgi:hypothetical protein